MDTKKKQANSVADSYDEAKEDIEQSDELVEEKEEELAKEKTEIHKDSDDKIEEYKTKYMRALADYQNLEKRSREERSEWIKIAGKNILLHMLPVLDTLMLASKHSEDQNLLVSIAQFLDTLKSEGVSRIETKGKKFDPAIMEAIQVVDGEEGKVVDEIRPGFMLHDKLLRAAEVTVGHTAN